MENIESNEILSLILNAIYSESPLVLTLLFLVLILALYSFFLSRRIYKLTAGKNGQSLESHIHNTAERVEVLERAAHHTSKNITEINTRLEGSVRGLAIKRFDPFQQQGGQQSFALALLNEHGSGAVISGIHVRDNVRVYAKEITNFTSKHELSEEEQGAIQQAKMEL